MASYPYIYDQFEDSHYYNVNEQTVCSSQSEDDTSASGGANSQREPIRERRVSQGIHFIAAQTRHTPSISSRAATVDMPRDAQSHPHFFMEFNSQGFTLTENKFLTGETTIKGQVSESGRLFLALGMGNQLNVASVMVISSCEGGSGPARNGGRSSARGRGSYNLWTCGTETYIVPPLPPNRGWASPDCCNGVKSLLSLASTPADRKIACGCLKQAASGSTINPNYAAQLPGKCGVSIPYPISRSVDCSKSKNSFL
ncbi:hypothetical protein Scep_005857 [Stephania cephalantha]|uniref:Non-specific lipid-transfer protein n=1 Tax=Stephania cephalantha TaxID=152367 RepID=A0AAP0KV44_9MAGN